MRALAIIFLALAYAANAASEVRMADCADGSSSCPAEALHMPVETIDESEERVSLIQQRVNFKKGLAKGRAKGEAKSMTRKATPTGYCYDKPAESCHVKVDEAGCKGSKKGCIWEAMATGYCNSEDGSPACYDHADAASCKTVTEAACKWEAYAAPSGHCNSEEGSPDCYNHADEASCKAEKAAVCKWETAVTGYCNDKPAKSCYDRMDEAGCKEAACKWEAYSAPSGHCDSDEGSPDCYSHTDEASCKAEQAAVCKWEKGATGYCSLKQANCYDNMDKAACKAAEKGCIWEASGDT